MQFTVFYVPFVRCGGHSKLSYKICIPIPLTRRHFAVQNCPRQAPQIWIISLLVTRIKNVSFRNSFIGYLTIIFKLPYPEGDVKPFRAKSSAKVLQTASIKSIFSILFKKSIIPKVPFMPSCMSPSLHSLIQHLLNCWSI